ncbi:hypothetical protein MAR_024390 [Mya arenaria]|uniref:Uncharacterized protein n=1 Tax=Mya arenaria TaxID=6604 RepID=A0ABY7DQP1_MYAAR|nr:hypothetical protein MAR_024390 [Mya arenaria]
MILGDTNARIGKESDFIDNDNTYLFHITYRKKNEFKILIFERLNTLHDNNPQEYWSLVKDVKEDKCDDWHSKKITKNWTQYFSNLFIV